MFGSGTAVDKQVCDTVLVDPFEGVISENVFDSYGRLSHMNFYANSADRTAGTIAERWSYAYDSYGRKNVAQHSVLSSPGVFTTTRVEQTSYDSRGRVIAEVTPEGALQYTFDIQGRMSSVAVRSANVAFTAPPERITRYGYDILGRLASVIEDATPPTILRSRPTTRLISLEECEA